jgi:hypothetical protein
MPTIHPDENKWVVARPDCVFHGEIPIISRHASRGAAEAQIDRDLRDQRAIPGQQNSGTFERVMVLNAEGRPVLACRDCRSAPRMDGYHVCRECYIPEAE